MNSSIGLAPPITPKWRNVRGTTSQRLIAVAFCALVFWIALALGATFPSLDILAVFVAPFLAIATVLVGAAVFRLLLFALSRVRTFKALPVPPPPHWGDGPKWEREPRPVYPSLALARAQCGWVVLALRVKPDGKVESYRVTTQAPARVFERATATALIHARMPMEATATEVREMSALIVFIAPGKDPPPWAAERIAAAAARELGAEI